MLTRDGSAPSEVDLAQVGRGGGHEGHGGVADAAAVAQVQSSEAGQALAARQAQADDGGAGWKREESIMDESQTMNSAQMDFSSRRRISIWMDELKRREEERHLTRLKGPLLAFTGTTFWSLVSFLIS